jgi:hypothetical protein
VNADLRLVDEPLDIWEKGNYAFSNDLYLYTTIKENDSLKQMYIILTQPLFSLSPMLIGVDPIFESCIGLCLYKKDDQNKLTLTNYLKADTQYYIRTHQAINNCYYGHIHSRANQLTVDSELYLIESLEFDYVLK